MKVAVVTRKLARHPISVVTAVIGTSNLDNVDDVEHYLKSEAKCVVDEFINKFPEFGTESTIWDITIHDVQY